jgi:hypothetical protein
MMKRIIAESSAEPAEPGLVLMAEQTCPPSQAPIRCFKNTIRPDMGGAHRQLLAPL